MPGYAKERRLYVRDRYDVHRFRGGFDYHNVEANTFGHVDYDTWDVSKRFKDVSQSRKDRHTHRYGMHPVWNETISLKDCKPLPSLVQTQANEHYEYSNSKGYVGQWVSNSQVWAVMPAWRQPILGDPNPNSLVPSNVLQPLLMEAFNYFSESFPEMISAAEFTQGLFQLKDLIPQIGESISKTVSGGYLNKKFGWDNLLSDLDKLSSLLNPMTARMKFLKDTYGKPFRLGFARTNIYTPDGALLDPVTLYENNVQRNKIQLVEYHVDFRATCWITQVLTHIDDTIGWIRALTGAFGLNNPVKAAWNLIPLSFVVDWFFNVDQYLDRWLRFQPQGWNVNDITHSVTVSAKIHAFMEIKYDLHQVDLGYIDVKVYTRQVGLPCDQVNLIPETLNPEQLMLLLGIFHQST